MRILACVEFLVVTCLLSVPRPCRADDPAGRDGVPAAVGQAARAGLRGFLDRIPEGDLATMGLRDRSEAQRAVLGSGWAVLYGTSGELSVLGDSDLEGSVDDRVREWEFPVLVDQTARLFLTVAWHRGEWRAVAMGGAPRARTLARHGVAKGREGLGRAYLVRCVDRRAEIAVFRHADRAGQPWQARPLSPTEQGTQEAGGGPHGGTVSWRDFRSLLADESTAPRRATP